MIIVVKVTLCASLLSLLSTIMAILIGLTQKAWRKRDGVLFFNIFAVDVIFSCTTMALCIRLIMSKVGGVAISNIFVFMYLLSWASQCIISINRYTMVSFPFAYKTILTRWRFCCIIITTATIIIIAMFTSIGVHRDKKRINTYDKDNSTMNNYRPIILEVVFPYFSPILHSLVVLMHVVLLLTVYTIECWLWKTAKGHRHRFQSLTSSISGRKDTSDREPKVSPSQTRGDTRKGSLTQRTASIMKRISFSHQRPPVRVRGTPVFLMAAHLLTVIPYMTLSMVYVVYVVSTNDPSNDHPLIPHHIHRNVCMTVQLLLSLRPLVNVGNHLSTKSLKRFTKLIQKVVHRDSRELFTEYYYENDEEVKTKMMKRKEATRLRPPT